MDNYTIYCTKSQTKKALELGAPIHRIPIGDRDESKPSYFTKQPDEEGWAECPAYYIPTAEQMIGWLEEREEIDEIARMKQRDNWTYIVFMAGLRPDIGFLENNFYPTRKEATLAAINAALDYLIDKKEE